MPSDIVFSLSLCLWIALSLRISVRTSEMVQWVNPPATKPGKITQGNLSVLRLSPGPHVVDGKAQTPDLHTHAVVWSIHTHHE